MKSVIVLVAIVLTGCASKPDLSPCVNTALKQLPTPRLHGQWKMVHNSFAYDNALFLDSGELCGDVVKTNSGEDYYITYLRGAERGNWGSIPSAKAYVEKYCLEGVNP